MTTTRKTSTIAALAGTTAALTLLTGLADARAGDLQVNQQLLDSRVDQLAAVGVPTRLAQRVPASKTRTVEGDVGMKGRTGSEHRYRTKQSKGRREQKALIKHGLFLFASHSGIA